MHHELRKLAHRPASAAGVRHVMRVLPHQRRRIRNRGRESAAPQYRQIAQLLCETRLLPRDVMVRLNVSAPEVATVVNDLLLRGVVTFRP